jgi:ketosteroid isomerase-like protein
MTPSTLLRSLSLACVLVSCSRTAERPATADTGQTAGIDSLNTRLMTAYKQKDPAAYGAIFTDSAVFEWPAFNTVRGRSGLEAMARANWASLADMDLRLSVSKRLVEGDRATEFGAFEQSWRDPRGTRTTEYGRFVPLLARQPDGTWRIDRFFGFEDSLRPPPTSPR